MTPFGPDLEHESVEFGLAPDARRFDVILNLVTGLNTMSSGMTPIGRSPRVSLPMYPAPASTEKLRSQESGVGECRQMMSGVYDFDSARQFKVAGGVTSVGPSASK